MSAIVPVRKDASFDPAGKGWNEQKNGPKKEPKWPKGVAHFDAEGCLFIKSGVLAEEIELQMKADMHDGKKRFWMYRDENEQEKAARLRRPITDVGKGDDEEAGHPVNMMCPCSEG